MHIYLRYDRYHGFPHLRLLLKCTCSSNVTSHQVSPHFYKLREPALYQYHRSHNLRRLLLNGTCS